MDAYRVFEPILVLTQGVFTTSVQFLTYSILLDESNPYIDTLIEGTYIFNYTCYGNANYTTLSLQNTLTVTNYTAPVISNVTNAIAVCNYCKFGYYNLKLPWIRQENCICLNKYGYGYNKMFINVEAFN
jgi:hypothetical protein